MQRKPNFKVMLLLAIAMMMIYTIPYTCTYAENVFFVITFRLCRSWLHIHSLTHSVNCPISGEGQKAKLRFEPDGQVV